MWQYEKIDVSEGIGINKANVTEERLLCHYWYFKYVGYKLEPDVRNKCHDLLMSAFELKEILQHWMQKRLITDVIYAVLVKMKLLIF